MYGRLCSLREIGQSETIQSCWATAHRPFQTCPSGECIDSLVFDRELARRKANASSGERTTMKSAAVALFFMTSISWGQTAIRVLIVDGQNNHQWKETTPVLRKLLEETGLFEIEVLTSPPHGADMSGFKPQFEKYRVILSNYNGDPWPPGVKTAFETYMRNGGGLVSFH